MATEKTMLTDDIRKTPAAPRPDASFEGQASDLCKLAELLRQKDSFCPSSDTIKLIAPAKVNLFLGVGKRRKDGYHPVTNILHTLTLHDVLYMRRISTLNKEGATSFGRSDTARKQRVSISLSCVGCEGVSLPDITPQKNSVYQAVDLLAQTLGIGSGEVLDIRLEKHIPYQAGLGGGSSDAAAALLGAASLWGVSVLDSRLEEVARSIGSDVPFFLHGGCARFSGAGEVFEAELAPRKESLMLIRPNAGLSTPEIYRAFDDAPCLLSEDIYKQTLQARHAKDVPSVNALSAAAETKLPDLAEIRTWAESLPAAGDVLLCGSGSATFVICDDFNAACRAAAAAKQQGWWARTSAFSAVGASVVKDS